MKQACIDIAGISLFVILLAVGMQAVRVAEANPEVWNSTEPVKDPPIVTVQSPQNRTYLQSEILLNFTIAKPSSWRDLNSMEQMREISYTLDGEQNILWAGKRYSMPKDTYFTSYTFPSPQQFSLVINVSNGRHLLQISAFGVSTYLGNIVPYPAYYPLNASETIAFSAYGPTPTSSSSASSPTLTLSPTDTAAPPTPPESPALTYSASPTQQTTLEPTQTPDRPKFSDYAPVLIPAGIVFLAVVAVALLIFLTKRRGRK